MPAGTDSIAPGAPRNLRRTGPAEISKVALAWDWPADVDLRAFEIHMDGALVGEVLWDVHYGGVESWFTVRHLSPGTTHTFLVKARDAAGNVSASSNAIVVSLLPSTDTTPPTPPTNFWGSTWPNCGFLDILWNGSTDNEPGEIEYEVYEDGIFRGVYRWEAFEASFGRHRYHIKAVDRSGNTSQPSNEIILDSGLSC
jgi:chitinase